MMGLFQLRLKNLNFKIQTLGIQVSQAMTHLFIRRFLEDYFQTGMSFVSRDGNVYRVVYQHGGQWKQSMWLRRIRLLPTLIRTVSSLGHQEAGQVGFSNVFKVSVYPFMPIPGQTTPTSLPLVHHAQGHIIYHPNWAHQLY